MKITTALCIGMVVAGAPLAAHAQTDWRDKLNACKNSTAKVRPPKQMLTAPDGKPIGDRTVGEIAKMEMVKAKQRAKDRTKSILASETEAAAVGENEEGTSDDTPAKKAARSKLTVAEMEAARGPKRKGKPAALVLAEICAEKDEAALTSADMNAIAAYIESQP